MLSLAVLLSGDCCPDPTAGRTHAVDCETAPASECPMTALTGQPCPMHQGHAEAALLASLLHDGVLTVEQIKRDLLARGVLIRPLIASA